MLHKLPADGRVDYDRISKLHDDDNYDSVCDTDLPVVVERKYVGSQRQHVSCVVSVQRRPHWRRLGRRRVSVESLRFHHDDDYHDHDDDHHDDYHDDYHDDHNNWRRNHHNWRWVDDDGQRNDHDGRGDDDDVVAELLFDPLSVDVDSTRRLVGHDPL
jgi:hypothetical protein